MIATTMMISDVLDMGDLLVRRNPEGALSGCACQGRSRGQQWLLAGAASFLLARTRTFLPAVASRA